jgi:hypothetical protein
VIQEYTSAGCMGAQLFPDFVPIKDDVLCNVLEAQKAPPLPLNKATLILGYPYLLCNEIKESGPGGLSGQDVFGIILALFISCLALLAFLKHKGIILKKPLQKNTNYDQSNGLAKKPLLYNNM